MPYIVSNKYGCLAKLFAYFQVTLLEIINIILLKIFKSTRNIAIFPTSISKNLIGNSHINNQ